MLLLVFSGQARNILWLLSILVDSKIHFILHALANYRPVCAFACLYNFVCTLWNIVCIFVINATLGLLCSNKVVRNRKRLFSIRHELVTRIAHDPLTQSRVYLLPRPRPQPRPRCRLSPTYSSTHILSGRPPNHSPCWLMSPTPTAQLLPIL